MKNLCIVFSPLVFFAGLFVGGCFNFDKTAVEDTDTAKDSDDNDSEGSGTDTCAGEDCPDCTAGPCCGADRKFKKPSAGVC